MTETKNPLERPEKLPSLDGVRGISILIVYVAHAGLDRLVPGRFGVSIFFLLSGYLITTLLIRERQKTGSISLKLFYARRVLRIFPPLYAIYAVTVLCLALAHHLQGVTIGGVCSQLFYYQNYWWRGGLVDGLGPLWSLAVEEHFYLFFPPLMLWLFQRRLSYAQIARTLFVICMLILVWRCLVVAYMPEGIRWARDATDTRADSILFGCVLACLEQVSAFRQFFNRRLLERFVAPACLVILLATFVIRGDVFRETLRYTLQSLAIAPLLIYLVWYPTSLVGRLVNTWTLSSIGVLSYSIYLVHGVVLVHIVSGLRNHVLAGLLGFAISAAFALLIRVLIEKPTEKLRRRLRHTRSRDSASAEIRPLTSIQPSEVVQAK